MSNLDKHQCEELMSKLTENFGASASATLATADGEVIASTIKDEEKIARRAAMASALISLSESFSEEVLGAKNKEISTSCERGNVMVLRLNTSGHSYLLSVSCDQSENLASVLRGSRDLGKKLTEFLD